MFGKLLAVALAVLLFPIHAAEARTAEQLTIYTSMKESLIGTLSKAFKKKHPGINVDYQSAGAGKLMAKIAAERRSGRILADVVWTSEVPDFYSMKKEGLLEQYVSPVAKEIINPLRDFDGSFTPARLGTLGIAYNTRIVKKAPAEWSDIYDPAFEGAFGIANPSLSGTAYMSIALLVNKFGWELIKKVSANRGKIGKGSEQVVDDTASGALLAGLAVDYITYDKIKKGAAIALAYPPEMLVVPSPVAIFKNSPNLETAKKWVDFLLSVEAQTIIAGEGTLPVRSDVVLPDKFNLPDPAEAVNRSIPVDYVEMAANKELLVRKFMNVMQKKK
jgi:iron(III) transport system substrate-binding protein